MGRYRWTGSVALGAMVLGVATVTGFVPARDCGGAGASGAAAHERDVRAAVAAGALSPDTGERTTTNTSQDGTYADGDTVIATAVPDPGFVFVDWLLDGKPYGGDEDRSGGESAVTFEKTGHTLTAVFGRA
ncbi:hypothetical protein R6L23_35955 [Streptomyces sp. SR27]|uniref:InlB B-repeat-containing protein n=1 Tax=Streptomyces sp. SR27 TaxID=3076630 RepID=UPI00295C19F3|nr:hypothetical protein [Streptomyces sp. SR27]MDV9193545.1 hypothetical protein [Streptomyces sp. SR27]